MQPLTLFTFFFSPTLLARIFCVICCQLNCFCALFSLFFFLSFFFLSQSVVMWAYMKGLTAERGIDVNAGIEKLNLSCAGTLTNIQKLCKHFGNLN